jgi:hypothetical protein
VTSTMTFFQCQGLECVKCYTYTSITCFHWQRLGNVAALPFTRLRVCVFFLHVYGCKCS